MNALTAAGYARDVRLFGEWFAARNGRPMTTADINRYEVGDYIAHLRASDYAPASINRKIEALRAHARETLDVDPLKKIKSENLPEPMVKALDRRDQNRLMAALEVQRNGARSAFARTVAVRTQAVVALMRYAGLRVAEVCALRMMDVALGDDTIHVRHGKGDKPRDIPLHAEAREAVVEWLAVRPNGGDDFVFIGSRGEPLQARAVQRDIEALARAANVHCTPHTLRHTFGRELAREGVDVRSIQRMMGHARIETTMIYLEPDANDLRAAIGRLK